MFSLKDQKTFVKTELNWHIWFAFAWTLIITEFPVWGYVHWAQFARSRPRLLDGAREDTGDWGSLVTADTDRGSRGVFKMYIIGQ